MKSQRAKKKLGGNRTGNVARASRFAFIVKMQELDAEPVKKVIRRKLVGEGPAGEEFSRHSLAWLEQARKHIPKFTASEETVERYTDRIYAVYERFLRTALRRDLRMADYAKRTALAIARASFCEVDDSVLDEAMGLIDARASPWGRVGR
jgi:hypothetical protein